MSGSDLPAMLLGCCEAIWIQKPHRTASFQLEINVLHLSELHVSATHELVLEKPSGDTDWLPGKPTMQQSHRLAAAPTRNRLQPAGTILSMALHGGEVLLLNAHHRLSHCCWPVEYQKEIICNYHFAVN